MGIKLGDISPLAGVVSGKGLFGKGFSELGRAMGPLSPVGYLAMKQRDKALKKKKGAAGNPGDAEEVMVMEAGEGMRKGGKVKKMAKGGKLRDLTGDGKVTRADVLKGRGVPGFSKGGSTASKRADGCATKGKTKGRFV